MIFVIMKRAVVGCGWLVLFGGCQLFVNDADREVYKLIQERQQAALGQTSDVQINREIERCRTGKLG